MRFPLACDKCATVARRKGCSALTAPRPSTRSRSRPAVSDPDRARRYAPSSFQLDASCRHEAIVTPLRKRRLSGELYESDPKAKALIAQLAALSRDELTTRAAITKRADPRYIPSECLVHFIRASRRDNNEAWFERLYRILIERVLRSLPRAEGPDGETESLTRGVVRDKVFSRFVELLSADRAAYVDKLGYFEVRFDGAVASLRRDAQEQAWRDEYRAHPLEYDEDSGELSPEVEAAAGTHDPFAASDFDDRAHRSRFDIAIEALPASR
jgi:hypothetical protein